MNYSYGYEDNDLYFEDDFLKVYERVSPTVAEYGFLEVTAEEQLFDKPTILCLGPVDCFHGNPVTANGLAKAVSRVVGRRGVYDSTMRILSITHPYNHSVPSMVEDYNSAILHADDKTSLVWKAVREFTENKFSYLFFENGKLRDMEKIKKSCRNINIVTHSLGSIFIQQMGIIIHDMLSKAGLPDDDINQITSQFFVLTLGNPTHLKYHQAKFSQLHIYGLGDKIAYARCPENHDAIEAMVRQRTILHNKDLVIVPFDGNGSNYALCMGNIISTQAHRAEDYRNIPTVYNSAMPRAHFPGKKLEISVPYYANGGYTAEHRADLFLTFGLDKFGLMIPTAIATSLSNALQNSYANHASINHVALPRLRQLLVAPRNDRSKLSDDEMRAIQAVVRAQVPDKDHPSWKQALAQKKHTLAEELIGDSIAFLNYRYQRSDPHSELAYARTEKLAENVGYNERIAAAFGERTQKGTPRPHFR